MAESNWQEPSRISTQRRAEALARVHVSPPELLSNPAKDVTSFTHTCGAFGPDELEIIGSDVTQIVLKIRQRAWTSLAVTEAFIKAASIAQQLTNCLTETLFPEAIARAKQLDEHLATTGKPVGALHGLPISLKDCFVTPPHPSSLGFVAWANEPTDGDSESVLVRLLREHGAVVYCKTNIPTSMMMMESDNHVWGPVRNPANLKCSAGGSSGGEGALLACQGSPLGIGTDIGGSIRIPAAYNSLYALKPSFSRLPTYGTRSGIPGNDFVFSVNGPMARSLQSVRYYCAVLLADGPLAPWYHDPKCIPLAWRTPSPRAQPAAPTRPLRLGFLPPHDTIVTAHPPVARALALTKRACEAAGHTVLDWSPAGHQSIFKSLVAGFLDLGGPAIGPVVERGGEPWFRHMLGYKAAWEAAQRGEQLTGAQLRDMSAGRNALQKLYLDRWRSGDAAGDERGDGRPVDALVAPVSPWAAVRAGATNAPPEQGGVRPYFGYTAVWSLMDVACATFPVTRASAARDPVAGTTFQSLGELDAEVQASYDPDVYDGAPVGLQVVGERLGEEKVLDVVGTVRAALEALQGDDRAQVTGEAVGKHEGWEGVGTLLGGS